MDIVALLDRPSTNSFGIVPFVMFANNTFRVVGSKKFLLKADVTQLISASHAWDVRQCNARIIDGSPDNLIAGWLGKRFEEKIAEIGAPNHTAPATRYTLDNVGSFWIGDYQDVYNCLSNWIESAAVRVFPEKNKALADLMGWVLPGRVETQAAIWWTRETEEEKNKHLNWMIKTLERDSTAEYLAAKYKMIVRRYLK